MKAYETSMQKTGRVIPPVELRRLLGLKKGDKVQLPVDGGTVTLTTARLRRRRAREIASRYAVPGESVVDEFLLEKRAEAERDDRPAGDTVDESAARAPVSSMPR